MPILITPSDTSADRAVRHHLVTVRCWVDLTHGDTYLYGPFEFAIVRGRKTRDCIGQDCWGVLATKTLMFTNQIPRFDLPTYSIHVDHGVHMIFPGMIMASQIDESLQPLHPR
jgi:hypothetical protein